MDEYGSELTFNLLDELARASVRGRVAADEFLASRHVGRVGPLLELLLMDRDGKLPLGALPDCQQLPCRVRIIGHIAKIEPLDLARPGDLMPGVARTHIVASRLIRAAAIGHAVEDCCLYL
jgi:hypothetical protein